MLSLGGWYIRSESDPRWDAGGEAMVGMFMGLESCEPARAALELKKAELNSEPPDDLIFGYMKY